MSDGTGKLPAAAATVSYRPAVTVVRDDAKVGGSRSSQWILYFLPMLLRASILGKVELTDGGNSAQHFHWSTEHQHQHLHQQDERRGVVKAWAVTITTNSNSSSSQMTKDSQFRIADFASAMANGNKYKKKVLVLLLLLLLLPVRIVRAQPRVCLQEQ